MAVKPTHIDHIVISSNDSSTVAQTFAENISNIASLFSDLWNAGVEMKDQLVDAFNAIVDFVEELPGRLLDAGKGMWDFITQPFEDAMNSIRKLWNDTVGGFSVTLPSWFPIGAGEGFTVPKLHTGGTVPGPPGEEVLALPPCVRRPTGI